MDKMPEENVHFADRDQEAYERLQLALDAGAILGTWVWDVPADLLRGDYRFANSFGLPVDLCRAGIPLAQVTASIHPDDLDRVDIAISEALARGGSYRCEYRVLRGDGTYHWIEASGRVDMDADGRPLRFPGVLLDIKARRNAESERDKLGELLRVFTAAVPGVVYAKDREGRMLVANEGTTDLIGKSPSQYLGKTDREFLDDKEQADIIMATDRRIMQSGVAEQLEEEVTLPDGTRAVWLSTKTPLRNAAGEVVGLVGSSVDVTARKNAEVAIQELNQTLEQRVEQAIKDRQTVEEALRQSQKMEAVGQLTGGLAHDFNNLLAGISGSLEMAGIRLAQGRIADLERYIVAAQGAASRAAALTHRLLAFSRRQTLEPKPTSVNTLIMGMEDLIRRTVGPAIAVESVAAGGVWPVLVDPNQLENALLNLSINARDAMPDGGRLIIETGNRWLDERAAKERDLPAGQYVSLCVSDNGTGMSADIVEKAFEPFFTTKPLGLGTGLGLSMIYGFARQSGGQVRIYSEQGHGTMVCIYLPRYRGEALEAAPVEETRDTGVIVASKTVLVIDDEPLVRMLVVEVVEELGFTVLEASDGPSGMKFLISDTPIDFLITDVGLPNGMNGRQVADAARVLRPDLKVLFVTGYAENAVMNHGHLDPGMHVVTKPFNLVDLARRIQTIISED